MVVTSKRLVGTDFQLVRSRTADSPTTSPTMVKRLLEHSQESHGVWVKKCGNTLPESALDRIASEPPKMIRAAYTKLLGFHTRTRIALTVEFDILDREAFKGDPRSPSTANG
jgi:hypothetical protein